ncbi:maleylpyruvate isomerase [Kribbella sp. VKM Ac-2569]|uniref:maleylpyruvate isomerase family mycothiol-dependent enzyme n=1 Tax=Kribbella sp. VKM Ac-2569 TaxID=2512220 RepID=UPI00102BC756|nr:maleylpyruvate isomerase family mycothiol-dependent enzyme [Kribbella sp. VKM Ac-2569]RZT11713.1 maleylpyruvate isomerase [Kribbella sp. VKM Ac-2569]
MRAREWVTEGTALCRKALVNLDGPSLLPGWTRQHVAAHLSLNAEALSNLVHWARTGEERPMYSSPNQRTTDIEAGALRPPDDLRAWFDESARKLSDAMDKLTAEQWHSPVRTAQGRQVPATEIVWLRSREVMVHAVDLGTGVTFADLPTDFLETLSQDIRNKRGNAPELRGTLPNTTAYLAGRPYTTVHTLEGTPAEPLPPWL